MRSGRRGWAIACGLAWKVGVLAIAVLLVSSALPREAPDDGAAESATDVPGSAVSALQRDTTKVRMEVGAGRPFAFYSLGDEGGRELVRVTYLRRGGVVVNLGDGFPIRPGLSAELDGTCRFGVNQGEIRYRLNLRPGGASGFSVDDHRGVRDGLGFTREGELVHDPSIAD